tara:strand:+ start:2557 stop:2760 length:204 start_codon:yes stop_codon:yes gene_type:complete
MDNMPTINDFKKDMTGFIQKQLQDNPKTVDKIIDNVCKNDDKIKTIMKTILSIEQCKMHINSNQNDL